MANKIPVTKKEVEDLVAYLHEKAHTIRSKKVEIPLDDLTTFMHDQEWIKEKDKNKKEKLRQRAIDRVRFYMIQELAEKNIDVEWLGDKYCFTIEDIIFEKQDIETLEREECIEDMDETNTFTTFFTKYIPHRIFSNITEAIRHGERPLIVGPKGSGKSRALEEAAKVLGLKCIRIALGQVAEPADLIGTKEIVEENGTPVTKFIPGLITESAMQGWMVIIDELDSAQPQVGLALHAVLEATNNIVCPTERGTQVIDVNPNFRIAATANSWGYGDETGFYSGVEIQNRATWDRLRPKFHMDYDPEMEQLLLKKLLKGVDYNNEIIKILYDSSNGLITKLRASIASEEIHDECSMRTLIAFSKHLKIFGYHKAMYYLVNEFKPEYRETIREMLINGWGSATIPSENDFDSDKQGYIPKLKDELVQLLKDIKDTEIEEL